MKNKIITLWTLLFLSTAALGAQDNPKTPTLDWSKVPTGKPSSGDTNKKDPIWLVQAHNGLAR